MVLKYEIPLTTRKILLRYCIIFKRNIDMESYYGFFFIKVPIPTVQNKLAGMCTLHV